MLRIFLEFSWNFLGIFLEFSWNFLGIFLEFSWNFLGIFFHFKEIVLIYYILQLFFPKSKKENGFWTFINVQKQDMGKSLGKNGFEKSLVTIMLLK
jgi:hypothetical protein